jgi:DNA gyrase subunit A
VITIKTSDRNGKVVGARLVHDDDELMLITNLGQIIRMRVDGISIIGRNTQGVRLMTMDDEELVVSTARLIPEDEDEEFEGEEGLEGEEASDSEDASGEVAGEEE